MRRASVDLKCLWRKRGTSFGFCCWGIRSVKGTWSTMMKSFRPCCPGCGRSHTPGPLASSTLESRAILPTSNYCCFGGWAPSTRPTSRCSCSSTTTSGSTANTEYRSAKPLFVLEDGVLRLTSVPVPEPVRHGSGENALPEAPVLGWMDRHSHLYRLIRDRVRITPALSAWSVRLGWLEPLDSASGRALSNSAPIPREFLVYERRPTREKEAAWSLTKALLREFKSDAEKAGSELAVFYVPTSPAVYPDAWRATQSLYGLREDEWDIRQPERDLARVCEDLGIVFLATTDRFRKEAARLRREDKDFYFKDEGHWNGEGHRFAAQLLHEFLAARLDPQVAR